MWSEILEKYGEDAKYYVGRCENCGAPIFEYDRYCIANLDGDEVYFCRDCYKEM